ncbi:MAG TPA: DsbA family protein [Actinomycetota bacterium]|nr:DsbA family protein [Actinomycetota bacterium]
MPDVEPGTIVVFSDIACPWSHLAVHRLRSARRRLGLDDAVALDHRPFPLELVNERPTPKLVLDAETPVVGGLAPDAGWQLWQRAPHEYPGTVLLALEAVQAAKDQGLRASEELDAALRRALFARSRNVGMYHEIVAAAAACEGVDAAALETALHDGRARSAVMTSLDAARAWGARGSPHVFLPDGTSAHNPGVEMHWEGAHGRGFPVIDSDDASVYDDLVTRAARADGGDAG